MRKAASTRWRGLLEATLIGSFMPCQRGVNAGCGLKLASHKARAGARSLSAAYIGRQLDAVIAFDPVDESLECQADELGADLGDAS